MEYCIDTPNPQLSFLENYSSNIRGWVVSKQEITKVYYLLNRKQQYLKLSKRDDIENIYKNKYKYRYGFSSPDPVGKIYLKSKTVPNKIFLQTKNNTLEINIKTLPQNIQKKFKEFFKAKEIKLKKTLSILVCPNCNGKLDQNLYCKNCKTKYLNNKFYFDFLTNKTKNKFKIIDTNNISAWNYDGKILDLIKDNPNKLFLDIGAGLRNTYYPNVINLEIVPYLSTDVLSVGEQLPFKNNSLDGIFSIAVLEHVKDPFLCAKEIERVLKPGGILFCCVPFLQPVHAYPHHYYNMTREGLKNLFTKIKINEIGVPESNHPIHSLKWILNLYSNGLENPEKKDFLNISIKKLLSIKDEELHNTKWVKNLNNNTQMIISGGNFLVGNKK